MRRFALVFGTAGTFMLANASNAQGVARDVSPRIPDVSAVVTQLHPSDRALVIDAVVGSAVSCTRTTSARAGITVRRALDDRYRLSAVDSGHAETHRLKHAAIGIGVGAAAGLLVGAVIGARIDSNSDATFPATPVVAVEGAGIGLVLGFIVSALFN